MKRFETVEQKVRKIAEQVSGMQYIYMNWSQANVEFDNITKPTIMYVLPPSGTFTVKDRRMRVYDAPMTQIAFLVRSDFDFDGEENENKVEWMKRKAIEFIKILNQGDLFEPINGEIQYQVPYNTMDDNLTGVIVNLTLREVDGIPLCGDIVRGGDE